MCIICEGKDISNETEIRCCNEVKELPSLDNCPNLQYLNCYGCTNLQELPSLNNCPNLQKLYCRDCTSLQELPSLNGSFNLQYFYCYNCTYTNLIQSYSRYYHKIWVKMMFLLHKLLLAAIV